MKKIFWIIVFSFICASCQTLPKAETRQDIDKTLQSVAEAVSGKPLTGEDVNNLKNQIATDPQARNSLQAIGNSMGAKTQVKYCPVDGARYSDKLEECPVHHIKLKSLDE